jgi:hypothetical protein
VVGGRRREVHWERRRREDRRFRWAGQEQGSGDSDTMRRSGVTYGLGRNGERATYGYTRRRKAARDGFRGDP